MAVVLGRLDKRLFFAVYVDTYKEVIKDNMWTKPFVSGVSAPRIGSNESETPV